MVKKWLSLLPCACLLASCASGGVADSDKQDVRRFVGRWTGSFMTSRYEEPEATLNIYMDNGVTQALYSSSAFKFSYMPLECSYENGTLVLMMNDEQNRATITLRYADGGLTGTYRQYDEVVEVSFTQVSGTPTVGTYTQQTKHYSDAERKQMLVEYADYEQDGTAIAYSYELGNRKPWEDIIIEHGLDEITEGKTDIELMKALLFWTSDNYKHGNPDGAPGGLDAISVMEFCNTQSEGYTNCRGLSIVLADLCRVYGIPAKHITCLPKETVFEDCHVVVLAYSEELDKWVMLDPTFKLMLQDEDGLYLDLQTLRYKLIHNEAIAANEECSYNGGYYGVGSYRTYMTKNTFRFASATDFYFGAEDGIDGNIQNMLIPAGYNEDSATVTTTSDTAFWITPQSMRSESEDD